MKLLFPFVVTTAIAILSIGDAEAQCQFCSGGISVDPSVEAGGETCGSLLTSAPEYDAEEYYCTDLIKSAEGVCCPPPSAVESSDQVEIEGQPDEQPVDEDEKEEDEKEGEEDSKEDFEPCPICTDGLTADPSTSLGGGGRTCGTLVEDAKDEDAAGETCDAMRVAADSVCCPPGGGGAETTPEDDAAAAAEEEGESPDDPCVLCPDGFLVDGATELRFDETCDSLREAASKVDATSGTCASMRGAESICCPTEATQADVPCPVCPDGMTVSGFTSLGEDRTCGGLMEDAREIEEGSRDCKNMLDAMEVCCPPPSCSVCPDGLTVDADTETGKGKDTCEDLMEDAADEDEGSGRCAEMKVYRSICCPSPVETTCPICTGGLAVDDATPIMDGISCATLLSDAKTTDEAGERCTKMKEMEMVCCPTPAESPCSVCSGGITVEEDVGIGQGRTCGGMMVDSTSVEEGSDMCVAMKTSEMTCCPEDATVVDDSTETGTTVANVDAGIDATTSAAVDDLTQTGTTVANVDAGIDATTAAVAEEATTTVVATTDVEWKTDAPTTKAPVAAPEVATPSPVTPSATNQTTTTATTQSPAGAGLEFEPGEAAQPVAPEQPNGSARSLVVLSWGLAGGFAALQLLL